MMYNGHECTMASIKKYLDCKWVHVEIARGDSAENYNYCSKLKTGILIQLIIITASSYSY